jgi:hypothetical protein
LCSENGRPESTQNQSTARNPAIAETVHGGEGSFP